MRSNRIALANALTGGSFRRELRGDVFYGATRVLAEIPISEWTLTGDIDGAVKTAASLTIQYTDDFAKSVSPRVFTDALAPYGQEVHLYMLVSAGTFTERVPMGAYRIDEVPSTTDSQLHFQKQIITVGSTVELSLLDRFHAVRRDRFRSLEQVTNLSSAWSEIARISGLQVTRNVTDVAIPTSIVYGRDRLEAVQTIATVLGGRAYMTADGSISIIKDAATAPVTRLQIGEDGVVTDVAYSMQSESVYNCVVGDFESTDGTPLHAEAAITAGALSVFGPYGYNTVDYPNDQKNFITTQTAADTAVANHLALVSAVGSFELPIHCILDPRLEIGDVVEVERIDRMITGRVKKYSMRKSGPMSLTLGVLSDVSK